MTVSELENYKHIKARIKKYNVEIAALQSDLALLSGIEAVSQKKKLDNLYKQLSFSKKALLNELAALIDFIENIDDLEIQYIFIARYIENKTYEQIGNELYMDRTTVAYKLKKYLK